MSNVVERRTIPPRPIGSYGSAATPIAPVVAPPRNAPPAPAPRRRRQGRWIVVGAILGVVVLLSFAGTLAYLDRTVLTHHLLPRQTFDSGMGPFEAGPYGRGWARYQDGAYLVFSRGGVSGGTASLARDAYAGEFAVDATLVAGSGSLVITCAGNLQGSLAVITTSGVVRLIRVTRDGTITTIGRGRIPPLLPGETHRIRLSCLVPGSLGNGAVGVMVDGHAVASGVDRGPGFELLAMGLKVTNGDPFVEVRYDDATAWLPNA